MGQLLAGVARLAHGAAHVLGALANRGSCGRARFSLPAILVLTGLMACADEYPSEYPSRTPLAEPRCAYPAAPPAPHVVGFEPFVPRVAAVAHSDPSRILVLQSTHLDRPAEVVGVVDAHVPMGSHEAALDVVRQRAAELGADAVVGVEFHHGEGEGQPTHLSGLAVRFIEKAP